MSKIKDNGKNSFVFYDSFLEAMKHLNDAEFRECVLRIRDYALEGIDEESQSPYVNIILAMAKPNLDSARRRYMASVENGKKGAEYGKLGGAPKGNQNARKNNPQLTPKQPLDVDANENVDVNEDEEVNENANANADEVDPSGSISVKSSFSNSSNSVLINEANDSELLKEKEERKEPPTEEQPSYSNASVVGLADKGKGETPLYSKDSSISSAPLGTGSVGEAGCSAARSSQGKDAGMDAGKYWEKCYYKNLTKLVDMKCGKQAYDKSLFERTVRLYIDLWGGSRAHAINEINGTIDDYLKMYK